MAIIHIKENEYDNEVKNGVVLVDFYADWCGPCKMLAPNLEAYGNEFPDVKILKVNVDEETNLAGKFGVFSVPTLLLYKNGEVVDKKVGFLTVDMLKDWIK
ncbi:MAG: thioredoxin [Bacilli bacterium]|nr:thioredoxin [Bacilli bacterium]